MAARSLLAAALLGVAFAVPIEERQSCGAAWSQCGGNGWSGPTCCASGSSCVVTNEWYSQCIPGAAPPPGTTTTARMTTAVSSTVRSSSTSVVSPSRTSTTAGGGVTTTGGGVTTTGPAPTGGATYTGNPFAGVDLWANSYYASEISTLAIPSLSPALVTAAAKVAKVPTFMWM